MIYLVSVACLLGSAAALLAPAMTDTGAVWERSAVVGVVEVYLACLLAVVVVLLGWIRSNPDAVGPALLSAVLIGGAGLAVSTIALGGLARSLALGLAGCAIVAGFAPVVLRRLGQGQGAVVPSPLLMSGAILVGWMLLWPALLAWRSDVDSDASAWGQVPTTASTVQRFGWWLPGLAVALLLPAAAAWRNRPDQPLLSQPWLGWIWIAVLIVVALIQAAVHTLLFAVESRWGEWLALALPVAVLGAALTGRWWPARLLRQWGFVLVVVLAVAVLGHAGDPLHLAGTGLLLALAWWRWKPFGALGPAIEAVGIAAIAVANAIPADSSWLPIPSAQWTVPTGAAVAGLLWLALAWRRDSVEALAIAALHLGLVAGRSVSIAAGFDLPATHGTAVLITLLGGCQALVLVALVAPVDRHRIPAIFAAFGLAITGLALRRELDLGFLIGLAWGTALCGELAVLAWRRRDPWIAGIAAVVVASDLVSLIRRHLAWSGLIAAFALLGLGLWASRRRVLAQPQALVQSRALVQPQALGQPQALSGGAA
ncbi:hypothetical protein LBMAG53_29690 [Planctomycetota bacterium]|nr:hypothetical protein LBMAG53_29690 [Planctomycetota bacterium]